MLRDVRLGRLPGGPEVWHIEWVKEALESMEPEYGKDAIAATLERFRLADREVYAKTMQEQDERLKALFLK